LLQAKLPVFILSGELDGQTQVTRVAVDAKSILAIRTDTNRKLVVVLPKVNHAQFAGNNMSQGDLQPEIDYNEAQSNIARLMIDFMLVNENELTESDETHAATERISAAKRMTHELLSQYWIAQNKDTQWCAEAQHDEAEFVASSRSLKVNNEMFGDDFSFARSKPTAVSQQDGKILSFKPVAPQIPKNFANSGKISIW